MKHRAMIVIGLLILAMLACGSPSTPPATEPPIGASPIGSASRQSDVVEHGSSAGGFIQVNGSVDLFEGDTIRVRNNGEALLDFGGRLRVRVFNNSELGVVSAEAAPDTPLEIRMALAEGG